MQRPSVSFTIRAAKELQSDANLPSIFCVPGQRQQTNVFSGEGIVEDVPLHLIIIPVSRQRLQTVETGRRVENVSVSVRALLGYWR